MPTTYLLKTEPNEYSYDDLAREGRAAWDGVANAAAQKHMRAMREGDDALIYHTGTEKRIAGLARVVKGPYADPAFPGTTAAGDPKRVLVDLEPVTAATKRITLKDLKSDTRFEGFALVNQPRLSVMSVPEEMAALLKQRAGLPTS